MCFSGHRYIPINEIDEISLSLEKVVKELIHEGYQQFATGGALGFDTLAAKTVLRLMKDFPDIQLHLVLPCPEQTRGWGKAEIEEYEMIKRLANSVIYTSEKYTKGCMFKRNRYLIDMSSMCVCYLRKPTGGTVYTVKYAKSKGIRIRNL